MEVEVLRDAIQFAKAKSEVNSDEQQEEEEDHSNLFPAVRQFVPLSFLCDSCCFSILMCVSLWSMMKPSMQRN